MKRITRKLKLAAEVLTQERFADSDPEFILTLYRRNKASAKQIYSACEYFGYRWQDNDWRLTYPRWLEYAIRKRDRAIMDSWR